MRHLSAFLLAFVTFAAAAQQSANTTQARLAAQNALFTEYWETNLKMNPTQATQIGDYRYNDKLTDYSLAGITRHHDIAASFLTRIKAISPEGFSEEDRTS